MRSAARGPDHLERMHPTRDVSRCAANSCVPPHCRARSAHLQTTGIAYFAFNIRGLLHSGAALLHLGKWCNWCREGVSTPFIHGGCRATLPQSPSQSASSIGIDRVGSIRCTRSAMKFEPTWSVVVRQYGATAIRSCALSSWPIAFCRTGWYSKKERYSATP